MLAVLRQILREEFPDVSTGVAENSRFREDLGMDSMDMAHFMVALEDRLAFRFDPEIHDLEEVLKDVGTVARFLVSKSLLKDPRHASPGL